MDKIIETIFDLFFENFSGNEFLLFVVLAIVLIFTLGKYIDAFFMTKIDFLVLGKTDEIRKNLITLFIPFILLLCMHLMIAIQNEIIVLISFYGLFLYIYYLIVKGLKPRLLRKNIFSKFKIVEWIQKKIIKTDLEDIKFILEFILCSVIAMTYAYSYSVNRYSCCVIASIVNEIILFISYPQALKKKFGFLIDINDRKKWYIYRLTEDKIYLCGNDRDINKATELKFISMDSIMEKGYKIKKDMEANNGLNAS